MKALNEFKAFLLRGNLVDVAVAFVVGVVFGALVTALVKDLITPLIAAIFGKPDFSQLMFTLHHSTFYYGDFINVLITFIIILAVLFFLVVKPVNALIARSRKQAPADPSTRKCPECLAEIPKDAKRCMHCTSPVPPVA